MLNKFRVYLLKERNARRELVASVGLQENISLLDKL